jgi:DNA-binding CsgD family transcriptional regulator
VSLPTSVRRSRGSFTTLRVHLEAVVLHPFSTASTSRLRIAGYAKGGKSPQDHPEDRHAAYVPFVTCSGIDAPVICAPFGPWEEVELAAVVCEAGALGSVGTALLTGAQSRVVALVIRGHSTRQIVEELHISANTVQEHLTAAFNKFGVRSRRELVAAMLTGRPG